MSPYDDSPVKKQRKKKSPTEKIGSVRRPNVESVHMKLPKTAPIHVSDEETRKWDSVREDLRKVLEIYGGKGGGKAYMEIHTHPNGYPYLSENDLARFLDTDRIRTMGVAQTDSKTGEVMGYGLYRRTKSTPKLSEIQEPINMRNVDGEADVELIYKELSKYGIRHKMVPAKGYVFDKNEFRFVRRGNTIDDQIARYISMSCLALGIFLFVPNITGNVVGNLSQNTFSWIGVFFLFAGLVGLIVLRRKKIL